MDAQQLACETTALILGLVGSAVALSVHSEHASPSWPTGLAMDQVWLRRRLAMDLFHAATEAQA